MAGGLLPRALRSTGHADPPADHFPAAPPRRHLSLVELLIWTYRDQRAHRYLRCELDWFLWEGEQQGIEAGAKRISGRVEADGRPVHPDAVLVHSAVKYDERALRRELRRDGFSVALRKRLVDAERRAELVIDHAVSGAAPERSVFDGRPFGWGCDPATAALPDRGLAAPRPAPVEPLNRKFSRYGRAGIDGALTDYAILVDDMVTVREMEWDDFQTAGRGRRRRGRVTATTRQVRVPVEYCPIDWRPGDALVAMTNAIAAAWEAEIAVIGDRLKDAPFRAHVLVDEKEAA